MSWWEEYRIARMCAPVTVDKLTMFDFFGPSVYLSARLD